MLEITELTWEVAKTLNEDQVTQAICQHIVSVQGGQPLTLKRVLTYVSNYLEGHREVIVRTRPVPAPLKLSVPELGEESAQREAAAGKEQDVERNRMFQG